MTRVAVVTGAARGIGAATTEALAAKGWFVLATDRGLDDPRLPYRLGREEELDAVAQRSGDRVAAQIADAADVEEMSAAIAYAEDRFGGIDAVVASAGAIAGGVPLWEMPEGEEAAVIDANLKSVFVTARVGVPALLRRPESRSGRFIAVSSAAAVRGLPMLAAYCAAKAGVIGRIRALAVELAQSGVTANAITPGSTATPLLEETARLYGLPGVEEFACHQPLARLITPSEVAGVIAWLASAETGAVTGAVIAVDGGMTL